ncbi:MAG: hypothetical protein CL870_03970 [Cytophagia bacterium]|nr:hypothetical protein [Cytophagia bacterium]
MTHISKAIKNLSTALEKEELLTLEDLIEIQRIMAGLSENMLPCESSDEGSDVSSVEEDSNDEDSSSGDSESSERRSYKKGPRSKGYALYIKNGGTRAKWSEKSDKYKDNYYERHN